MKRIFLFLFIILTAQIRIFAQLYSDSGISLTGVVQGSADWGDYNNDGFQDLLVTGTTDVEPSAAIYRNNGDNTFTEMTAITLPGVMISSVKWADFDNDNDLDILLTGSTSGNTLDAISKIYMNDGGVFNEVAAGLPGVYLSSVSVADQDRDGDIDVFMTGMRTTGERISAVFNNNGNGIFTQLMSAVFTPVCYGFASFGDYDNDGYPDVFVSGQTAAITRISKVYHNNGDGSYSEISGISFTGMCYNSGAWSDMNGDGYLDLIIIGEDAFFSPVTKIYINNKAGSFTELTGTMPGGARKCSVAAGDFDNDGDPDIILSGTRNSTRVTELYMNDGTGAFSLNSSVSLTGVTESSVSLSDYDNDGDLDFLLNGIMQSGVIISKLYLNNSSIANIEPQKPSGLTYTVDRATAALTWNKVSGDASTSLTYNMRIGLSATGNEKVSSMASVTGIRKVTSAGNTGMTNKFIFRNLRWNVPYYASVQSIDNSYAGSDFSTAVSFQIAPQQPSRLTGSNINNTSILLKWVRGNGDRCILFAKEGTSSPVSPVDNTTYYANSFFGDGSPVGSGWFCIYKGEADSVIFTGLSPDKDYSVYALEFQGTPGFEKYATTTNPDNDNIGVFSSGIFTILSGTSMPGLRFSSVAWGDYDNDGYLDILLTGRDISGTDISKVFRNNGNNTFSDKTEIVLPGVENGSCAWGDYNNDDLLDIVLTGYSPSLGAVSKIFRNNGSNSFTEQTSISLTGVMYSSVAWGDYDNDNNIDILITGSTQSGTPVSKIYRNTGNGNFTEQTGISLTGVKQGSAVLGDYNNDGFIDILLCGMNSTSMNVTKLYKNTGAGNFAEQTGIQFQGVSFSSASWGDFDNDNNLDIILTGASGYNPDYKPVTKIYRNIGNNSFSELTGSLIKGIDFGSAEWGDYNNDGLLDIMLTGDTGSDYEFMIYLNNGNKTFSRLTSVSLPGAIACGSSSADYDSDGDLDVLLSGYTGALISQIYRNNLNLLAGKLKPNKKPDAPTSLASEISPHSLRLSWSGVKTDETYFVNMSYNVRCRLQNDSRWTVTPHSAADGYRSLNDLGNAQLNRSFTINNPPSGKLYWQVQAVDQNYSGSEWSLMDSVILKKTQAFFRADTVCLGTLTTFTDQSVSVDGIVSWQWDFADGTSSVSRNTSHTYASAGTYQVKLTITSSTGVMDLLAVNVIVRGKPSPSFNAPNVCIGAPSVITNTTNLNGLTASSWSWDFGDGQSSAVQDPLTHNYALSGTYTAKLKVAASNGCSDSISRNVIVAKYPENSISVAGDFVTVNSKLTICAGANLLLTAKSDPLYTYQWRKDDNDLTGAAANTYSVNLNSGVYNATIVNTLANCITLSEQKSINVKPVPVKPLVISDNYTTGDCVGNKPVKLKVDQAVGSYQYSWLRNGIPINNSASPVLEDYLDQGDYTVTADLNGCSVNSDKFSIAYQGAPEKPFIYAQGPVKWYLACDNLNAKNYMWFFNDKPIDGALKYYYVANQNYGVYRVSVGDSKGCYTRSDTIRIPTGKFSASNKSTVTEDPLREMKIYPNPTTGLFSIRMDNESYGEITVTVISQGGKEVLRTKFIKATTDFSDQIDLSGQALGSYLVNIRLDDHVVTNQIILR